MQIASIRPEAREAAQCFIPRLVHQDDWQAYLEDQALTLTPLWLAHEWKDWQRYVKCHQNDWKVDALIEALMAGLRGKACWSLLKHTWDMTNYLYQRKFDWWALLTTRTNPGPKSAMSVREKEPLAALPNTLTLYRSARPDQVDDFSWTTDLEVAKFFARRTKGDVYVLKVPKKRAIMYLDERNESEVIIDIRESDKPKLFQP